MPPRPEAQRSSLPARSPVPAQRSAPVRRRVGAAAIRRRRILAGLLLTTLLVGALTPLTPVPWWAPVLLLVVTVADLVHLRVQVRRSREVDRTRKAVRQSVRSRLMRFDALDRLMTVRREMAEDRAAEEARWAATEEALRVEREAEERRGRRAGRRLAAGAGAAADVRQQADGTSPRPRDRPHPSRRLERGPAAGRPGRAAAVRPALRAAPRAGQHVRSVDDADDADGQLDAIIAASRGERLTPGVW